MNASNGESRGALKEFAVLAVIILAGMAVAAWCGLRDGRVLAALAYGDALQAAQSDEEDGGEREDEAEEAGDADEAAEADDGPDSSPEAIARGAALFQANCVACHGEKADGKGPAAVAFTPAPRDFTDPAAKWTQGRLPADLFATITGGVSGTGMAGFGGALSEAQRWDLVHYLASLPGVQGAKGAQGAGREEGTP